MNDQALEFQEQEASGGGNFISQLPSILWQRRWFLAIPALLGLILAIATMIVLPTVYRSTAILLVQAPSLPRDVLGSAGNEMIEQRIERIRQQLINRSNLIALIDANKLYEDRGGKPLSEVINTMREAIVITPTEVELQSSQPDERTIAFTLTFDYSEAVKSQLVAQRLMERLLELNSVTNSEKAMQTVEFLTSQSEGLRKEIADIEGQLAEINSKFAGAFSNNGVTMVGGSGGSYDVQIAALQRENTTLISQREMSESSDTRDPMVKSAEAALAAAQSVYTETHPDVIFAKQRLEEAKSLAAKNAKNLPLNTIDRQIEFNNSQIAGLRAAKAEEQAQISTAYNARMNAPVVQISQLQRRLEGLNTQYQAVQSRLMVAKAGEQAEDEQMGERLVVVDPPVIPDSPYSPDRLLILAIGIAGGVGAGFLLAMAIELFLKPVRDPDVIAAITGGRPLALIPLIEPIDEGEESKFAKLRGRLKSLVTTNPFRRKQA